MIKSKERRKEQRVAYDNPIWFAEDFHKKLSVGRIVDLCSAGTAFTCRARKKNPTIGQKLISRFSITHFNINGLPNTTSFTRIARICRIDNIDKSSRRVALKFTEPLPFKPCELTVG